MSEAQLQLVYGRADAIISQWYQGVAARVDRLQDQAQLQALYRAERGRFPGEDDLELPTEGLQEDIKARLLELGQAWVELTLPEALRQAGAARYMAELRNRLGLASPSNTAGFMPVTTSHIEPAFRSLVLSSVPAAVKGYDFNTKLAELTIPPVPGSDFDLDEVLLIAKVAMAAEFAAATSSARALRPILPSHPTYWPSFAEEYRARVYGPLARSMVTLDPASGDRIRVRQFHPERQYARSKLVAKRLGRAVSAGVDAVGKGGSFGVPGTQDAFEMPLLAWSSVHVRWIDAGLDLVELLQNTVNWQGQERQKLEFFRTIYWPTAILWVQPCFAWSHRTKADSKAKLERWVALSEGLIADAWRTYNRARADQHSNLLKTMSKRPNFSPYPDSGRSTPAASVFDSPAIFRPVPRERGRSTPV